MDLEIDVELLKSEIKKTYASVSEQPETEFIFPTGRAWAEDLDYPRPNRGCRARAATGGFPSRCPGVCRRPA